MLSAIAAALQVALGFLCVAQLDASSLDAAIDTGEFGPALAQVAQMPTEERDQALQRIAIAQVRSGDRPASLQTASRIDDDRLVAETLSSIRETPMGSRSATGGSQADFDPLIDLITGTIATSTWSDLGGPGTIDGFETGVHIDAAGVMRRTVKDDSSGSLARLRQEAKEREVSAAARSQTRLRKVSLTRLERQVQLLAARGGKPTEEMRTLAGLQRIKYLFVYPEEGDLVLAGPAGDWRPDREGRLISVDTHHPVLRLDDLVVVFRHILSAKDATFGCRIYPTQASLKEVQEFLAESKKAPLKPGQSGAWLKTLKEKLGLQEIDVHGIDPRTRIARSLVEADYRMKLVGLGLEEGVLDVPSYLEMIKVSPGQAPPPMDVLRWWFTLNYQAIVATTDRDGFELQGQGVKLLSENEMLTESGQRIHTGESDPLNSEFAQNFTREFKSLAIKYPIYAELQNICDLAIVAALCRNENLPEKVRWHLTHFGTGGGYQVEVATEPKHIEAAINHRIVNKIHILCGVGGGVTVNPNKFVQASEIKTDTYGLLKADRGGAAPKKGAGREQWWWD
ncbi:MAG: DUF1598 domain-containing protein [Pirellulales bacterium]|nr:DUF1598 domain-containing protein [Pirellulales bacterium]